MKKGYFSRFFSVSLSFTLASFTSPFSLSLSLFFHFWLFFILPCFLLFFPCLVSWLLFHDQNNIKIWHLKGLFSSILSVVWVSCFALSFKSLFYFLILFSVPYLKLCFWSTSMFIFKKTTYKTPMFGEVPGCNQRFPYIKLCFAICEKLSFVLAHFGANFDWSSKSTVKLGISAQFKEPQQRHNNTILRGHSLGQVT